MAKLTESTEEFFGDDLDELFSDFDDLDELYDSIDSEEEANSHVGIIGEDGAEERDELYTNLLNEFSNNYVATKSQAKRQKTAFFIVILVFLGILLIGGITLLVFALFNCSLCNFAVVIGASVDILGSFIAIPTIIAKHLFPEKIDNDVIEVVKLLVENDKNIRELMEKHKLHDIDFLENRGKDNSGDKK